MPATIDLKRKNAPRTRKPASHGLLLNDSMMHLLDSPRNENDRPLMETLSPTEFSSLLSEWIESHHDWPVLSDEAISRDSIYGDNH